MNSEDEKLKQLLVSAIQPIALVNDTPRDLWPQMLVRFSRHQPVWGLWDWIAVSVSALLAASCPAALSVLFSAL